MPVTIKDIARNSGVSHSTVSRALNFSPLIPQSTAERIRKIASEMGYLRSAAARSLKTNRSQALGVIVTNIDDPFFAEILQGVEEVAQNEGYSLFIAASQGDPERERHIVQAMREHRVDGVIICSALFSTARSNEFSKYGIPIVVVNNQAAEDYRFSIYHDDVDGSRQITRYLIGLGHKQIAYLGNASAGRSNFDRLSGFEQEMANAGLSIPVEYKHEVSGKRPENGSDGAEYFLSLKKRPTAIICYNDMIATGVLKRLNSAGLKVPEDISVTGFDNIEFSAFTNPPLTTFDQPKRYIGSEAARMVLKLLEMSNQSESSTQPIVQTLQGKLLLRQSCASPKTA